ncbi:hypothetical protein PTKIN_Ptkin15bG0095300 [Pterospermum kingtungense]
MLEPSESRWAFIWKIYSIVASQLLATIAVAATMVTVHPIAHFFVNTAVGLAFYIVLIIMPFIAVFLFFLAFLCPLYYYHQRHLMNYLLLGVFTVSLAFAVGLTCAFTNGKIWIFNSLRKVVCCLQLFERNLEL